MHNSVKYNFIMYNRFVQAFSFVGRMHKFDTLQIIESVNPSLNQDTEANNDVLMKLEDPEYFLFV